ncbi:MAG: hypothetical protein COV76_01265 [Candidatus Omnitrophica bacterium CG11_big_fil_rev_8_21_14_0_20_64_10]|nr:MAG: hypothetical protein COV76_01265 [Candidatus Omnitrophica bacterium CG11_big_fil_rev_8_21_14_0_20_64_10]
MKPRRLRSQGGFTLIELLVVVFIVGILGTIAIPQYQKSMEIAKVRNARAKIQLVVAAQKTHFLDWDAYAPDLGTLITRRYLTDLNLEQDWTYSTAPGGAGGAFTVTATRNANGGAYANQTLLADTNGNILAASTHTLENFSG